MLILTRYYLMIVDEDEQLIIDEFEIFNHNTILNESMYLRYEDDEETRKTYYTIPTKNELGMLCLFNNDLENWLIDNDIEYNLIKTNIG